MGLRLRWSAVARVLVAALRAGVDLTGGAGAWHLAASRRPLALLLTSSRLRPGAHLVPECAVVIELDLGYGHGLAVPARCQRHHLL
jgi:hypothetical protein